MRTGVIAKKLGMTRLFDETGAHVPVTVLSLEGCQVTAQRTKDRDGYVALQLGAGSKKPKNTSKAERGHFAKGLVEPKHHVAEFRVSEDNLIEVGAEFTADHFLPGQKVDVAGVTVGKGFAGAIKRWNFGGLERFGSRLGVGEAGWRNPHTLGFQRHLQKLRSDHAVQLQNGA